MTSQAARPSSAATAAGSTVTIPAKNQNGSMIRTMMKVLVPIECTSNPTNPAVNPMMSPRQKGSSVWRSRLRSRRQIDTSR